MENDETSVNHPSHYTQGKREVIDLTELLDFCTGNAVKYILRAPYKGNLLRDLKKARWYFQHLADSDYGTAITADLYHMACEYGNDTLKELFECLYAARQAGDLSSRPYKVCVEILTKKIQEQEFYEVKRELKRCKEELRRVREAKAPPYVPEENPKYWWEVHPVGDDPFARSWDACSPFSFLERR